MDSKEIVNCLTVIDKGITLTDKIAKLLNDSLGTSSKEHQRNVLSTQKYILNDLLDNELDIYDKNIAELDKDINRKLSIIVKRKKKKKS